MSDARLRVLESKVNGVGLGLDLAAKLLSGAYARAGRASAAGGGCLVRFDFAVASGAGASVLLVDAGGNRAASGVADAAGLLSLYAFQAGAYTWWAASGASAATGAASGACGDVVAVAVSFVGTASYSPCGSTLVPTTLFLSGSVSGGLAPLTYDPATSLWTGCFTKVIPAGGCPAGNSPVHVEMQDAGRGGDILFSPVDKVFVSGHGFCFDVSGKTCSSPYTPGGGSSEFVSPTSLSCSPFRWAGAYAGETITVTP